jgi:hypothetical protein
MSKTKDVLVRLKHSVVVGKGEDAKTLQPGGKPVPLPADVAADVVRAGAGELVSDDTGPAEDGAEV